MMRSCLAVAFSVSFFTALLGAQAISQPVQKNNAELRFVVYVSRHGVRSPTGKLAQYNIYSSATWPTWDVPPGYLTPHGYHLMQLFGAYDRLQLANEGILSTKGCEDATHVTVYADSDQRTRETGKALAAGLFPSCAPVVQGLPENQPDALFHPIDAGVVAVNSKLAVAAVTGRLGGDPANLTAAYRSRLSELDMILGKCGSSIKELHKRVSLFDVPVKLSTSEGGHSIELRGPLNVASTVTENFLLEYAEGMDASNVGWGCVNGDNLRSLIELHTAASDFVQRTHVIARMQASHLIDQIRKAMEQAATGKTISGVISKQDDKALFLIGHDTNLSNIAGLLNMTWIADGRRDDTPPGGSLVFELWHTRKDNDYFVRTYYTAQTLEQMRVASELTMANPPVRVPVFLPGCGDEEISCSLKSFLETLKHAVTLDSALPNTTP